MPRFGGWAADTSNLFASQFAAKNYYSGELSGARLVLGSGKSEDALSRELSLFAYPHSF